MIEFNSNQPGVGKVEIEGATGSEILSTVHLDAVVNREEGIAVATKVHLAALNRISFFQSIAIENGEAESEFSPIDPEPPGVLNAESGKYSIVGYAATLAVGLSAAHVKTELEQVAPPGERNFGLFRSAMLSTSPVEEFMHLYNIMLMFFHDDEPGAQERLDKFIIKGNPHVEVKPYCRPAKKGKQKMILETVYTRLRNEFGHSRPNVDIDQGENLRVIQSLMNHKSLATTARYLHSRSQELVKAVNGLKLLDG